MILRNSFGLALQKYFLCGYLIALVVNATSVLAAGCDTELTNMHPDADHSLLAGACDTNDSAVAACNSWLHGLPGYESDSCINSGNVVFAGNLCIPKATPGTCPSGVFILGAFWTLNYYITIDPEPLAQCNSCNNIGDPVNPANNMAYSANIDISKSTGDLSFARFYNSGDQIGTAMLAPGWRSSFARKISPRLSSTFYKSYDGNNTNNSSAYTNVSSACASGFNQLKSRVLSWQSATANYANGLCQISKNAVVIGILPIYAFQPQSASTQVPVVVNAISGSTVTMYDVTRDDGQLIRFTVNNGVITPPPGIGLRLQQTSTGFTITDVSDNVEQYDASGKLLTVTSRGGVVQTMNYDSANRLSSVMDSFGHQLILNYDAQGHLSAVTRQ